MACSRATNSEFEKSPKNPAKSKNFPRIPNFQKSPKIPQFLLHFDHYGKNKDVFQLHNHHNTVFGHFWKHLSALREEGIVHTVFFC